MPRSSSLSAFGIGNHPLKTLSSVSFFKITATLSGLSIRRRDDSQRKADSFADVKEQTDG